MKAWLAKWLLGVAPEEVENLRKELAIERTLRVRAEEAVVAMQTRFANANGHRCRLQSEVTELRGKIARCKCRVN